MEKTFEIALNVTCECCWAIKAENTDPILCSSQLREFVDMEAIDENPKLPVYLTVSTEQDEEAYEFQLREGVRVRMADQVTPELLSGFKRLLRDFMTTAVVDKCWASIEFGEEEKEEKLMAPLSPEAMKVMAIPMTYDRSNGCFATVQMLPMELEWSTMFLCATETRRLFELPEDEAIIENGMMLMMTNDPSVGEESAYELTKEDNSIYAMLEDGPKWLELGEWVNRLGVMWINNFGRLFVWFEWEEEVEEEE